AYVIYTSGSTGQPKGVLTTQQNIVRTVVNNHYLTITPEDRILQLSNYAFDGSAFDIFGALLNGALLVLIRKEHILDIAALSQILKEEKITIFFLTTALFNTIVDLDVESLSQVRHVLFGGEKVSASHVARAYEVLGKGRIIHVYGPTESTVFATYYAVDHLECGEATVPIGVPLANTRAYIVDQDNKLQPIGVPGELCIAGDGLARGYLNRPELTAEKFVANPFGPGGRMYRTGDLARWLPGGSIEYLGRIDHQVKIRGYRIELGEIEAQLLKVESVREAVVVARETEEGQKDLCAYVVAGCELVASEIRAVLSQSLPGYMIPAYFVQIDRLPLTPNGKIDRKALPAPAAHLHTGAEYIAARTPVEETLVSIWETVLGVSPIGIQDNFFDLGGHSLRATTLVAMIHRELGAEIPLRTVFQEPTIAQMARMIEGRDSFVYAMIPTVKPSTYYPVSSAQKRLYILSQMDGGELSYNMPAVITIEGELDRERLEETFRKLIRRHESLRTGFELVEGKLVQRVYEDVPFAVEYTKASEEQSAEMVHTFVRPFALQQVPLLRVGLLEIVQDRHLLLFDMHHIISDGVSMSLFIREFVQLYEGKNLPPLRIQYKDYAAWQQANMESEQMRKQEAYWLDEFSGEMPVLELPTDYARPAVRSFQGRTYEFVISSHKSEQLRELA
ncbi:non-ribosomal peptide synthetase, partial [Paenibacillus fonticola]|uniref:non-ribosomal peptide synthetase n=1 Tax=Paenibacillus fonticola TaxID=379896 RepID=UPI000525FC2D